MLHALVVDRIFLRNFLLSHSLHKASIILVKNYNKFNKTSCSITSLVVVTSTSNNPVDLMVFRNTVFHECLFSSFIKKKLSILQRSPLLQIETADFLYVGSRLPMIHAHHIEHNFQLTFPSTIFQSSQNRLYIRRARVVNADSIQTNVDIYIEDGKIKFVGTTADSHCPGMVGSRVN